jgi:hypothetical protein
VPSFSSGSTKKHLGYAFEEILSSVLDRREERAERRATHIAALLPITQNSISSLVSS